MFRVTDDIPEKKIKLDVKDQKILVLLSENSRMALSEISKKIKLARDTTAYRIKRMQELGIIQGFYPVIDFKRLGYHIYRVFMLIDESDRARQKELVRELIDHPNTRNLIQYSDRWDIELTLLAKDIEEFDYITTELLGKFSSIILEKIKLADISTYYSILFPYHFYKDIGKVKILAKKESDYVPDKKDLAILKELSKDCRVSTYEIAKKVNLSADAIGLRIKKLYNTGIIKKFTVLPNFTLLRYSWYTFALQMKVFSKKDEAKFKTFVKDHPHIIRAEKTLGTWDIVLYIIAADLRDFHKTIKQIKHEFSDIVKNYDAWVALKESVFKPMPEVLLG